MTRNNPWISDELFPRYDYFGSDEELGDIDTQLSARSWLEAQGCTLDNEQLAAIVYGGIDLEIAAQWLLGEIGYFEAVAESDRLTQLEMVAMYHEQEYERLGKLVPINADAVLYNRMHALRVQQAYDLKLRISQLKPLLEDVLDELASPAVTGGGWPVIMPYSEMARYMGCN